MKKIFISYGDIRFKPTLERIGEQAKNLNIFDEIILYNENDLPLYIKSSPLMAYTKGGGYWIWKPYIILNTLKKYSDDDIIVYADSGCSLEKSEEWNKYFELMNQYKSIVFHYRRNTNYNWKTFDKESSPSIKHWVKKETSIFFDDLYKNNDWKSKDKIMAGFMIFKSKSGKLINEWYNISILHPSLITDPLESELQNQNNYYIEHRHDQAIITPIAYNFSKYTNEVLILPETSESNHEKTAVIAARLSYIDIPIIPLKTKIRLMIKKIIGLKLYVFLKSFKRKP